MKQYNGKKSAANMVYCTHKKNGLSSIARFADPDEWRKPMGEIVY